MHISQDLNLLNVGAGRGELLTQLRQVGFQNLTGLELSSDYVEFARTNYGLPMLVGDLQQRPFDIDPYDGLIMSEVLECVPDLNRCIEHMSSWLKPKGFVILEVSDAEFFGEEMNAPFQEFKAERINFFTDASLINLMQNHGFRPLAKRHHLCEKGNGTSRAMLTMIFQWGADKKEPVHEAASEQGIRRYLDRCKTEIDSETKLISQIVATQEPILVWGVGTLCQRLLATTDFKHANIVAFIDSDPQYHGKLMHHRQVLSPNDVINRFEPILIASWSQQDEIMHLIQKTLAMKNRIITLRPLPAKPE
jgi:SAM-dependent methyltransferase